ncbi:MAG: HAD family hydrolase [Rhizomicrobium sp.]
MRFEFQDKIRPDTKQAIADLKARGIAVEMLTGDRAGPAMQIASEAGIDSWKAAIGPPREGGLHAGLAGTGRTRAHDRRTG